MPKGLEPGTRRSQVRVLAPLLKSSQVLPGSTDPGLGIGQVMMHPRLLKRQCVWIAGWADGYRPSA